MIDIDLQARLHAVTNELVDELVSITPEMMTEIQFEIVSSKDGGADFGLLANHPDARRVALSQALYDRVARYLPLVRRYVSGWRRSLIVLQQSNDGWRVHVDFESSSSETT